MELSLVLVASLGEAASSSHFMKTGLPSLFMGFAAFLSIIGLWRQLAWGRFLTSSFVVIITLLMASTFFPDMDALDPFQLLDRMGIGLYTGLVMSIATLHLLPLVALGWNKAFFRKAIW